MRQKLRDIYLRIAGFFVKPIPGIHIINSHYVTSREPNYDRDHLLFENFLKNLSRIGKVISLDTAVDFLKDSLEQSKEVKIALTFDDGFEECYTIIAPLLEKYNCRGAFFLNANYIESNDYYQKDYNLRVGIDTKKPMSWNQVIDLHKRGHIIGSHGLDHHDFGVLTDEAIEYQLSENKRLLENRLNYECEYFAWTYGRFLNFPSNALRITEKYHQHIFSGTDYKNYFSYNNKVVNRRHLEAFWPKSHTRYFLSVKKNA